MCQFLWQQFCNIRIRKNIIVISSFINIYDILTNNKNTLQQNNFRRHFVKNNDRNLMKKQLLYIAMFLIGLLIGSFVFEAYGDKKPDVDKKPADLFAMNSPKEERPTDYIQSLEGKIGKTFVVSGIIEEAYKNKNNEVVLYLKDKTIPVILNCTLYQSDRQIKYAIKLGERVSIKGKFTDIDEEMYLKNCKIIYRSPK
jgi:hypothetical protein